MVELADRTEQQCGAEDDQPAAVHGIVGGHADARQAGRQGHPDEGYEDGDLSEFGQARIEDTSPF